MRQVFIVSFFLSLPLVAQAFGNNLIQLPSVGMMRMESFGVGDHAVLGIEYSGAIGYQLWWLAETAVGFGRTSPRLEEDRQTIASAHGILGVRYFFGIKDLRPFITAGLHYLQFIGKGNTPWSENHYTPIWIGLRPSGGLEWQFGREMSLQAEIIYDLFFNFVDPFKQSMAGKLSWNLYF